MINSKGGNGVISITDRRKSAIPGRNVSKVSQWDGAPPPTETPYFCGFSKVSVLHNKTHSDKTLKTLGFYYYPSRPKLYYATLKKIGVFAVHDSMHVACYRPHPCPVAPELDAKRLIPPPPAKI
jgi:hypothetical protein